MTSANEPEFTWSGPVPVSMLSKLASGVLDALRQGDTVTISRRREIVAVLMPTTIAEAATVVDLDDPAIQLSTRELERGNVSAAVDRAARGERLVLTYQNRPVGLLRPIEDWQVLSALADPGVFGDPTAPLSAALEPGPLRPADLLEAATPAEPVRAVARSGAPRYLPARAPAAAMRRARSH